MHVHLRRKELFKKIHPLVRGGFCVTSLWASWYTQCPGGCTAIPKSTISQHPPHGQWIHHKTHYPAVDLLIYVYTNCLGSLYSQGKKTGFSKVWIYCFILLFLCTDHTWGCPAHLPKQPQAHCSPPLHSSFPSQVLLTIIISSLIYTPLLPPEPQFFMILLPCLYLWFNNDNS